MLSYALMCRARPGNGVLLYLITLIFDLFCIIGRWLFLAWLLGLTWLVYNFFFGNIFVDLSQLTQPRITGLPDFGLVIVLTFLVSVIPEVLSVFVAIGIITNLSFWHEWYKNGFGGRIVGEREKPLISLALDSITADHPKVKRPGRIYVLDGPSLPNGYIIGNTVFLTTNIVQGEHLAPVLAHLLGHINSWDGRLIGALDALTFFQVYGLSRQAVTPFDLVFFVVIEWMGLFLLGGIPLKIMGASFETYFRENREYQADTFAVQLGQGHPLIDYYEDNQLTERPMPWNQGRIDPPAELRIDRIMQQLGILEVPGEAPKTLSATS